MKVKKIIGLYIQGFIPFIIFFLLLLFGFGLIIAIGGAMMGIVIGMLVFIAFYRHPMVMFAEGEGMMAMTIDSTGIIEPFIVKASPPAVRGVMKGGKEVNSIFDRNTIFYTKPPQRANLDYNGETDDGFRHYDLKVKKGDESKITFAFQQYPTFIYNKNTETLLSKDALAKMEIEGVVKHQIIYLTKKTEELTGIMRDFARYIMESLRPKRSMFEGKGRWIIGIIIAIFVFILMLLFAPKIMEIIGPAISSIRGTASQTVETARGSVKTVTGG